MAISSELSHSIAVLPSGSGTRKGRGCGLTGGTLIVSEFSQGARSPERMFRVTLEQEANPETFAAPMAPTIGSASSAGKSSLMDVSFRLGRKFDPSGSFGDSTVLRDVLRAVAEVSAGTSSAQGSGSPDAATAGAPQGGGGLPSADASAAAVQATVPSNFLGSNSVLLAGISLPGGMVAPASLLRPLKPAEFSLAFTVFATSLNYASILISDALGLKGAPFTMYIGSPGGGMPTAGVIVLNLGPDFSGTADPLTFIHELTHAWQSQHHINPYQFMINSIASQAKAALTNTDAYAYTPGKFFGFYAAEQIARQVEKGVADVRRHMTWAGAPGVMYAPNVLSLSIPRSE
jgi:hypothetical protein